MSHTTNRVTFLGVGAMGSSLILALLKANTQVVAWNRTKSRPLVEKVVKAGATYDGDIASAVAQSDTIVICLVDYEAIRQTLAPLQSDPRALSGRKIINLTNGTPNQVRELETWLEPLGPKSYFDGAVMVTPEVVHTPHSFLVYSGGTETSFNTDAAPIVAPLGTHLYFGSEIDAAASLDLAALSAMYGMFLGALNGMKLLNKTGVKAGPVTKQVTMPLLQAVLPLLGVEAEKMDNGDWLGGGSNPLSMQLAGIQNIQQAFKEADVEATALEPLARVFDLAIRNHGADAGLSATTLYL